METLKYTKFECNQFVEDMENAGYEVEHYNGRYFWEGPAVRIEASEYQDVVRSTDVQLQHDSMGRSGLIVYPIAESRRVDA